MSTLGAQEATRQQEDQDHAAQVREEVRQVIRQGRAPADRGVHEESREGEGSIGVDADLDVIGLEPGGDVERSMREDVLEVPRIVDHVPADDHREVVPDEAVREGRCARQRHRQQSDGEPAQLASGGRGHAE